MLDKLVDWLGLWGILSLTIIYFTLLNLFFEYVVNRGKENLIIGGGLILALAYTVFHIKLVIHFISNKFKF
jgi:hypothetical protein